MRASAMILALLPGVASAQAFLPVRDLGPYLQDGAAAAFVASGVAALEDCAGPRGFRDARLGALVVLEIHCRGSDEEFVARLAFVPVTAGTDRPRLVPFRLELLP